MDNRNLSVGLFVIVSITIAIVLAVWFTGKSGSNAVTRYLVLIESDVSGLTLGGPVYFMGVQVGEVSDLGISPGNPTRIRVVIEVDEVTPVDSGTWATLAAQGITGVSVINLSEEPGDRAPLRPPPGERLPVIPYRDTGFSALLSSAPAVLEKLDTLLVSANDLLDEDNRAAVAQTLSALQSLVGELAAREEELAALPASLEATLGSVRTTADDVQVLIADASPGLTSAIANLERATAELQALSERLGGWMQQHDRDLQAFTAEGLGQVPALVEDTRDTVRELRKVLEAFREDPSRALYRPSRDAVPVEE